MSIELKPCPFCGGEASINDDPTGNGGKPITRGRIGLGRLWSVECDECGADAGYWQSEEIAVLNWNHRAERTCKAANVAEYAWDDFECSECGWVTWSFFMEHEGCGTVCQPRYCPNCGAKVVDE